MRRLHFYESPRQLFQAFRFIYISLLHLKEVARTSLHPFLLLLLLILLFPKNNFLTFQVDFISISIKTLIKASKLNRYWLIYCWRSTSKTCLNHSSWWPHTVSQSELRSRDIKALCLPGSSRLVNLLKVQHLLVLDNESPYKPRVFLISGPFCWCFPFHFAWLISLALSCQVIDSLIGRYLYLPTLAMYPRYQAIVFLLRLTFGIRKIPFLRCRVRTQNSF